MAKPVTLCCSCWICPAQLQASGCLILSALLGKQRCPGRSIIWLSWEVPSHFCEGHIPTWHPATSLSLDACSQSEDFIGAPNLSWKTAWIAAMYFCFAVCLETVGVFQLTFTKNIYLEAHTGVQISVQGFQCNFTSYSVALMVLLDQLPWGIKDEQSQRM